MTLNFVIKDRRKIGHFLLGKSSVEDGEVSALKENLGLECAQKLKYENQGFSPGGYRR
jgi:hypothetical protein